MWDIAQWRISFFDYNRTLSAANEVHEVSLVLALDDDGRSATTTVADTGAAVLARLERMCERDDDPGTRASDGVTKRDTAAKNVDLASVEAQHLVVGECHGGKGLVDLKERDVVLGQAGAFERLGDGIGGGDGEVDRCACRIRKRNDLGERLDVHLLHLGGRSEHNGRGTIVERRRVGSGNGTVLVKHGSKRRDLFELDVFVFFILRNDHIALLVREGDGCDFVGESVGFPRLGGSAVGFNRKGILLLAGDRELLGRVLGTVAHGDLVVDVVQTVLDNGVERLDVAVGGASRKIVAVVGQVQSNEG